MRTLPGLPSVAFLTTPWEILKIITPHPLPRHTHTHTHAIDLNKDTHTQRNKPLPLLCMVAYCSTVLKTPVFSFKGKDSFPFLSFSPLLTACHTLNSSLHSLNVPTASGLPVNIVFDEIFEPEINLPSDSEAGEGMRMTKGRPFPVEAIWAPGYLDQHRTAIGYQRGEAAKGRDSLGSTSPIHNSHT